MKFGIGNDIIDINRFQKWNIKKFQNFFTCDEQQYIKKIHNAAGIFAAKEAIIKALYNVNITNYTIFDIEISHKKNGLPILLSPIIINSIINISISHCNHYASAIAFIYLY